VDLLCHSFAQNPPNAGAANHAAQAAVRLLAERGCGTGGLILLDRDGTPALAFNTPRMAYGYVDAAGSFFTGV